jgi:hypothetical protein
MVLDAFYLEVGVHVFCDFKSHKLEILAACSAECKTAGVSIYTRNVEIEIVLPYRII